MSKLRPSAKEALAEVVEDGMTIAVGGFGLCGVPYDLIEVVRDSGVGGLTVVSNNMGVDGKGLGLLLENKQVSKVIASYAGENKLFAQQYLDRTLEVEFTPQGTLSERLRAGGSGIAAFYTRAGVGTPIVEGKPLAEFDGGTYVQERGIVADVALVHAHTADPAGNLVYRAAARNFNPVVATCARLTVAEAEHLSQDHLYPERVITPGIYVDRLVRARPRVKDIEKRTVRPRVAVSAE